MLLVYNPRSGRGRAKDAATGFARALSDLGHQTSLQEAGAAPGLAGADADALVIVGGDGTLHHAIAELLGNGGGRETAAAPPLYHLPLGTQNLFAREMQMNADPQRLHALLQRGHPRILDVGTCNGRPFVLMCSVGPDAGVLARLNAATSENGRRRPITHRSYIMPMLAELAQLRTPVLSASVDGTLLVDRARGMVVVGNCRRYAMGFDPALRASMSDGLLDTVFFPAQGRAAMVLWAVASRLGRHTRSSSLVYRTGRQVQITVDGGPVPYQLDGEVHHSPDGRLSIGILPGALRVWA